MKIVKIALIISLVLDGFRHGISIDQQVESLLVE